MRTVEVDDHVFEWLRSHAEPFVDRTPNDVLRRVLGLIDEEPGRSKTRKAKRQTATAGGATEAFVQRVLESEFGGGFRLRSPYRTMYETDQRLIYFQNFNKAGTSNLWYRLKATALETLGTDRRAAYVVFTNPAERFAYLIPVDDLEKRAAHVGWNRDDLEVNIDPATNRWRELEWDLSTYLRRFE